MNNYNFERFVNRNDLAGSITYVVKPNDTLYKIAKEYNIDLNELIDINKLSSTMIYPNQIIFIPKRKQSYVEYVTLNGDTLDSIMKSTNTNIKEILRLNDIYKLELTSGQIINLKENSSNVYTILTDDDINSILSKNNITALELLELNKDKWLSMGTKIIVR